MHVKIAIILLLSFYSIGTVLCPLGDFRYMQHFNEMYDQCAEEDPDINIADFVFEHLMNLEDVIAQFENETEENEKPHQPFQQVQVMQQVVVMNASFRFECSPKVIISKEDTVYPIYNDGHTPAHYLSEIFHPPIV